MSNEINRFQEINTQQNNETLQQEENSSLANEMTMHWYKAGRMGAHRLFSHMSELEYMMIWVLSRDQSVAEAQRKIYLEDIANKLKLPISRVSKMIRELQDKGLVTWKHDGIGETGTYIQITEKGIQAATNQQEKLKGFYKTIINKFGKEKFVDLMTGLAELESMMEEEIEKVGDE